MTSASRIHFPQSRLAPKEVIQRLREIDPMAELVYFGRGRWVLGVYGPNAERIAAARRRLSRLSHVPGHRAEVREMVQEARLHASGFRPIEWYTVQGEPGGAIVEDFRLRDFNYRNRREATFAAALAESAGDNDRARQESRIHDWVDSTASDAWRHAFKHPHTVS